MSSKSEGIGERSLHFVLLEDSCNRVQWTEFWIGMIEVDRRMEFAGADRLNDRDCLDSSGSSQAVAGHRFRAVYLDFGGMRTEYFQHSLYFAEIAGERRCRMGIDVVDFFFRDASVPNGLLNTSRNSLAVFARGSHVIGVAVDRAAQILGINGSASCKGVLQTFQNQNAGSIAHHK